MSSDRLHPYVDPRGGGVAVVGSSPSQGGGGPAGSAAEVAAFAVEWQVRGPAEARAASPALARKAAVPPKARGLTFEIARALGTVVVTARGTLDHVGSRALRHVLDDLIENQGNMIVVVDLHGVTDVDPDCLDVFVTAHGWAVRRGGQLSLTGCRLRVGRALEETGVNRLVKVTSDRILAVPARA